MSFVNLGLAEPVLRAVLDSGYTIPTPIQEQAIPLIMTGQDVMGCAQTGTGKTAAFALPILHRLIAAGNPAPGTGRRIRCLVLSPTRELAAQIDESFRTYGKHTALRTACIFGGMNQNPQIKALRNGIDVLIATPGRLIDLMEQGHVDLGHVQVFVLDEGDQMLDMGFIHAIRRITPALPKVRQSLMFSATMPREIRELSGTILRNPAHVQIARLAQAADKVEQSVYHVEKNNKPHLLTHLINNTGIVRALVFTRTKHGADRVAKHLIRCGIKAEAIHGNKTQSSRTRALEKFKSSKPPILVATDIAARGLDIDEVSHVVNFDVPNVPETYVHRIGRTGRAGASGAAVSFCMSEERSWLRQIEKLTRVAIPVKTDHPVYPARSETDKLVGETTSAAPAREPRRDGDRERVRETRTAQQARREEMRAHSNAPARPQGATPRNGGSFQEPRRPQQTSAPQSGRQQQGRPQEHASHGQRPPQGRPQGASHGTPQGGRPQGRPFGTGSKPARPQGQSHGRRQEPVGAHPGAYRAPSGPGGGVRRDSGRPKPRRQSIR